MASIRWQTGSRQGWKLFYQLMNKRSSISLGKISEDEARKTLGHVEHLISCIRNNSPIHATTDRWLSGLDDTTYGKLANAGFVAPRKSLSKSKRVGLVEWIDRYIDSRADVKPTSRTTYYRAKKHVEEYFGKSMRIDEVTRTHAAKFQRWLTEKGNRRNVREGVTGLADGTVRSTIGKLKLFFKAAVRDGLVDENPFADLASAIHENADNFHFVEASIIEDCIAVAESTDWKTILALGRYAGLRIPSELVRLRWEHVDFAEGKVIIHASKTERHRGKGRRECPLFNKLAAHLLAAKNDPDADPEFVISSPKLRTPEVNLREGFLRHLKAAGHAPWPNLFQNLRKSRATELDQEGWTEKAICSWLGHGPNVLRKHYIIPSEDELKRAAKGMKPKRIEALENENGGDGCGDDGGRQDRTSDRHPTELPPKKTPEKPGSGGQSTSTDGEGEMARVDDTELESVTSAV